MSVDLVQPERTAAVVAPGEIAEAPRARDPRLVTPTLRGGDWRSPKEIAVPVTECRDYFTRDHSPLLTVIVPVYNEAATVVELLRRVLAAPIDKQVIVVDDGSTDGTGDLLQRWACSDATFAGRKATIEILAHPRNRGKGAAIRTGLSVARGRFTLVQDADLEYDPRDYERLLAPVLAGEADVVYGSRYLRREGFGNQGWGLFRVGVCALNVAVRAIYGARLTDEATCLKLFSTAALRSMDLRCERFEFCPEVTAKASRLGLRILELPVAYHPRDVAAGKKIRWRDGVQAAATLWRWRNWRRE